MSTKFPRRNGSVLSWISFSLYIPVQLFLWVSGIEMDYAVPALLVSLAFLLHCCVFLPRRPAPVWLSVLSGLFVAALLLVTAALFMLEYDYYMEYAFGEGALYVTTVYGGLTFCLLVSSLLYVFAPKFFNSFVGISWEESCRLAAAPAAQRKEQKKRRRALRAAEKAYAKIDKYNDYLKRGTITQEEFESLKAQALAAASLSSPSSSSGK